MKLLDQSANPKDFQCAGPTITYPGFVIGTNTIGIQANGALRINATGGPALHLPSLNILIRAPLTVTAGQVQFGRPTLFRADRNFRDGFDTFAVGLNPGGQIISLSLQRKNATSNQSQSC